MGLIRQIRLEIRNILRSKFLLIIAIIILAAGIAIPLISLLNQRKANGDGGVEPPVVVYGDYKTAATAAFSSDSRRMPMPIEPGGRDGITIDGITIYSDNPFFWNLQSLLDEQKRYEQDKNPFSTPAALDLTLALIEEEIQYYLSFAQHITNYQDYRTELAWRGIDSLYDRFFLENNDEQLDVLLEVAMMRKGADPEQFRLNYVDITAEEKLAAMDKAEENLNKLQAIVVQNDFTQYIQLRIQLAQDEIASLEENIEIQEQAIIDNPSQEDNLNQLIVELRRQIELIRTNQIPILEYRLEKNIIPGQNIWQNNAINDIENARNQLAYMTIMSEEEWNNSRGDSVWKQNEETYAEYVANMQRQIDALNLTIIVAQESIDSDRPDMKYVTNGSRARTVDFLQYSLIVSLFGVLLGGWLIASEYQQGTIRLLMIRPKTRTKILMSKFTAALIVWLGVYLVGSLLNMVMNGICFGFQDFTFPNYSVAGETGFFLYFVPKLLACVLPILFSFTLAFLLSVVVKNTAVAIAVPVVFFIGSFIMMNLYIYSEQLGWIAYTPIPYLQMATFLSRYANMQYMIQTGVNLNITMGVLILLGCSLLFTLLSIYVFKKRDIVN